MEFNADQNVAFPSGEVGIGTGSPALPLDVAGIMRAIDDAAGCTATERGAIRFNSAGTLMELCDGASWLDLASGSGAPAAAGADRQIQFNSGGVMYASSGLVFDNAGRLGIGTENPAYGLDINIDEIGFGTEGATIAYDRGWNRIELRPNGSSNNGINVGATGSGDTHVEIRAVNSTARLKSYNGPLEIDATNSNPLTFQSSGGNVAIGAINPQTRLDVAGIMRAIDDAAGCTATERGAIRFNSAGAAFEVCDGASWGGVGGGSGLWSDSGSGYIEYNSALGGMRVADVSGEPAPNIIGVTNLGDLGDTAVGSAATGDMLYFDGTDWTVDSGQLYWDGTNNRLGIGTGSPAVGLHVRNGAGTAAARVEGVGGDANLNLFAANNWTFQSLNSDGRLRVFDSSNSLETMSISSGTGQIAMGDAAGSPDDHSLLTVNKTVTSPDPDGWDATATITGDYSGSSSTYTGNAGLQVGVTSSITGTGYDESYGIAATITAANDGEAQNGFVGWFTAETHPNDIIFGLYSGNAFGGASTGGQFRGLHIEATDTDVTNYGVYQNGAAAINYFEGKVGIGTTSPWQKFQVQNGYGFFGNDTGGNAAGTGFQSGSGVVWWLTTAGNHLTFSTGTNPHGTDYVTFANGGKVGIGTTSPAAMLHVHGPGSDAQTGTLQIEDTDGGTNASLRMGVNTTDNHPWIQSHGGAPLHINPLSNNVIIHRDGVGRVGIKTASPNYTLDVRGSIGNNTTQHHSDIRWKNNIELLDRNLAKVLELRGVSFEWRKDEFTDMHFPDGRKIGFIAQEIEPVLPELVHTNEEGYKSVAYANLVPVLLEATKELKTEKDREIAALRERISALEEGQQAVIKNAVQPLAGESEANAIPSDADFAELRAALDTRQAYIDKLETQIGSLARDIEGLKATTGYDEGPPVWLKVITLLLLALAAILAVPVLRSRTGSQSQGAL